MEAILYHRNVSKQEAREIAIDMLNQVGISSPAQRFQQYSFELSGGMRQRAMIAVALSSDPSLLIADEIEVMYLGRIMESGTTRDVINDPQHPYTQKLLKAIPRLDHLGSRLTAVGGDIPGLFEIPGGCPFHKRCRQMIAGRCNKKAPAMTSISETHSVSCFLYE